MANELLGSAQLPPPNTRNEDPLQPPPSLSASTAPVHFDAPQEGMAVAKLQELIDVCKEILTSSRQTTDVEKNQDSIETVSFMEIAQEERKAKIWAAVKAQEIEIIEVMTPDELERCPSWDEEMLQKAKSLCPQVFSSWKDIWEDFFNLGASERNIWLQERLMIICCSIDEKWDGGGWNNPDQLDEETRIIYEQQSSDWEMRFKAKLGSALLASTSYIRYVGSECAELQFSRHAFDIISKVMVTFLVVNHKSGDADVTIWHVLKECYRRRILVQPDADRHELYLNHIGLVISVTLTLNITWCCNANSMMWRQRSIECLLGLPVANVVQIHRFGPLTCQLETAKDARFSTVDLDISSLRSIGQLRFEWIDRHERHLLLNPRYKTLEICWFSAPVGEINSALSKWFRTSYNLPLLGGKEDILNGLSSVLEGELVRTWALLFSSSSISKGRQNPYASLPEPRWFLKFKTMRQWLTPENMKTYTEITSHLNYAPDLVSGGTYTDDYDDIVQSTLCGESLVYSSFPIFEMRLRELRAYMDSIKPYCLHQLLRDNRDSLTYYTFWGVIVFGILSVAVALFALGISVAQTVASFKALQLAR